LALLNQGIDPAEIMRKKGVVGNANIVEKIVHLHFL
jgi:hypothetical protein